MTPLYSQWNAPEYVRVCEYRHWDTSANVLNDTNGSLVGYFLSPLIVISITIIIIIVNLEVHRIRIRLDTNILGSAKIRIQPDPKTPDPVNRIHYHV